MRDAVFRVGPNSWGDVLALIAGNDLQIDDGGVNKLFTLVLEINRHAIVDCRLHLTDAPVWPVGVADKDAGSQVIRHCLMLLFYQVKPI